jgi:hypothetical protein
MKRKRKQKLTGMRRRHDPHAGREASRYEQPIASRELILPRRQWPGGVATPSAGHGT